MSEKYNIIIIGSGPGGYVAAIRAAQLGMTVAVVEKSDFGGVCLNRGCIPTKALLKSAEVVEYVENSEKYGVNISDSSIDLGKMIARSKDVVKEMNDGVHYLMKKNGIAIINGYGRLNNDKSVSVTNAEGQKTSYHSDHIILATGSRPKELGILKFDGKRIINSTDALSLTEKPQSMIIVGAGAIGVEFAYFFNKIGVDVTLIEGDKRIVPLEDNDVSIQLEKSFQQQGITVLTNTKVVHSLTNENGASLEVETDQGKEQITCDIILSAVGVTSNIENIGLEDLNVITDRDKILVDEFYETSVANIYAIGDIVPGPALAHVASAEAIICVEKIAGKDPEKLNYNNVPSCIYSHPEIASVGLTEDQAISAGYDVKTGVFPLAASGKAKAMGASEGFVKVLYDAKYGEFLGGHMIGANVTEILSSLVLARKLEATGKEVMSSIYPHPSISEAFLEATLDAFGEAIHL